MKHIAFTIFTLFNTFNFVFATDSLNYSVKYRYIRQRNSDDTLSKADDIMILTISKNSSNYFSYLKHFGDRNFERDIASITSNNSKNNVVVVDANSPKMGSYFANKETEVIQINYESKIVTVTDKLTMTAYIYSTSLDQPEWAISNDTMSVLGQHCQKATTKYRGRNYIAWFSSTIPYSMGPWLFNGLPGLILKISDDKGQFVFECMQLGLSKADINVFKPYENIKLIDRKKLIEKKKLMAQDYIAFAQEEDGHTITVTNTDGSPLTMSAHKLKPYNPIDLSK